MRAEHIKARVASDHRLTVQLSPEAPSGEVDVIILYPDTPTVAADQPAQGHPKTLEEFDAWLALQPSIERSPEAIEREIAMERESWD